jgi:hypothetical protein
VVVVSAEDGKIISDDEAMSMHDDDPFNRIAEFTDIAGPVVVLHPFNGIRGKLLWFASVDRVRTQG